ncbi:MAG: WecB/TagA/CpsF family glycosyltransferase [Planctomycetales bacterium]|nr:WecB/TagA/CpsF family glycosyltransferase [Planctomycetales bacterium]
MINLGRHNLLGVGIHAVDYAAAVQAIVLAARRSQPLGVSALAVHGVMTGVLDRQHCYRLNQLELVVPDGQPVRWGLNLLYRLRLADRVYGPQLTLQVCQAAADEGLAVFLFGSTAATLAKLERRLGEHFPELRIVGRRPSQFRQLTPEEGEALVAEIRDSGAQITMVGIGCPRQEVWAFEFRQQLSMPVLAVGAAFAFHAGELSQAPAWMQERGLEWFYRWTREPQRLWKRYLLLNPAYVSLLGLQWLRLLTLRPHRGIPPSEEARYG